MLPPGNEGAAASAEKDFDKCAACEERILHGAPEHEVPGVCDRSGMTRGECGQFVIGLTKGIYMGIKQVVWGSVVFASLLGTVTAFADTISGTAGAGFQSWGVTNLNQNGKPYWDNLSIDGSNKNIGFFLVNAPTAPLAGAPGAVPFWGNTFNSGTDSGGTSDLNFFFKTNSASNVGSLLLELAANSHLNEFGWYDTTNPSTLHPIFVGTDAAPATDPFAPSAQYGFYLKSSNGTFFTQSSLNTGDNTNQQHFAVFQQSSTNGAEVYWIGIEDLNTTDLNGRESGAGDYNDMLVRISAVAVPEPSVVMLVLSGTLLMLGLRRFRR